MADVNRSRIKKVFGCSYLTLALYVAFCLALATAAYLRPLPTYDRYLYAGAVASLRYSDPVTIHNIARAEFDNQPSPFRYESVADEPYFADVRDNPFHFAQQLGIFRMKLGYVIGGFALWRAGLPILVGLRLISACSLFVVALMLLVWTHEPILSSLLLLTPPLLNMGRMVTADPFSTTILVIALFALTRRKDVAAATLLLISIVIRPDNVILVLMMLVWMIWRQRLRLSAGSLLAALAILITALVNRFGGVWAWRVCMQHSFSQPEVEPLSHQVTITFDGYLHDPAVLKAINNTI